jgi:hypothetical protein
MLIRVRLADSFLTILLHKNGWWRRGKPQIGVDDDTELTQWFSCRRGGQTKAAPVLQDRSGE